MLNILDIILKKINTVVTVFSVFAFLAGAALATATALLRYVFNISFEWSEELTRIFMLSGALLTTSCIVTRHENLYLGAIFDSLKKKKGKLALNIVNTFAMLVMSFFMAKWSFSAFIRVKGQTTLSHVFPKQLPFSIIPISMVLGCFAAFVLLLHFLLKQMESNGLDLDNQKSSFEEEE